jgi:hypothetical protein
MNPELLLNKKNRQEQWDPDSKIGNYESPIFFYQIMQALNYDQIIIYQSSELK